MSEPSAELVNPFRMARAGSTCRGEIPLSRMSRLSPLLSGAPGSARFELSFDLDSYSRPVITGSVKARLEVICQRCLEPMGLDLNLDIELGIARSDEEAAALFKEREPLTLTGDTLSVAELVEDELILALPAAPLHAAGSCRPPPQRPAE